MTLLRAMMRHGVPALLWLTAAGCKKEEAERPLELPSAANLPAPKAVARAPKPPPPPESFGGRYLLIAAVRATEEEARAAAPEGATILDSTQFTGLNPCLHLAVVAAYEGKDEALAAAELKPGSFPRYAGRYAAEEPVRRGLCQRKAEQALAATAPRWVHQGLMELGAEAPADEAAGVSADPSGRVRKGDRFDVYDANGARVEAGCKVKGFTAKWTGQSNVTDGSRCGARVALAELACSPQGDGLFALPRAAPKPQQWRESAAPDAALDRVLNSPEVRRATAALKGGPDADGLAEATTVLAWRGPQGTVSFARWVGQTGDGAPECERGDRRVVSEVVLWPKTGAPQVLHAVGEREAQLLGVTDLGSDGKLELSWQEGSADAWLENTPLHRTTPFCGLGC